jgi:hypothetical protein
MTMAMMTTANDNQNGPGLAAPGGEVNIALMATGVFGALAALVGLLSWDGRAAVGIAAGTAIAVANLWVFKRVGQAFLSLGHGSRAFWGLVGALKFAVLLAGVGLLLRYRVIDAVPLIVGYASLPVGITLSNFLVARFQDGS